VTTLAEAREAAERRQIERALEHTDGRVAKAAELLGVSRTTLWEKMRRIGLTPAGET
jgi:DNA-binding NtrC family response regulator